MAKSTKISAPPTFKMIIKKNSFILKIVMTMVILLFLLATISGQGSLIFSDNGAIVIKRTGKNGVGTQTLLEATEITAPNALTLDMQGQLYIGDGNRIIKINAETGGDPQVLIDSDLDQIAGIVLNQNSSPDQLFWIESTGYLKTATVEGDDIATLLGQTNLSGPTAIAIDATEGKIYIADGNKIFKCDSDGSNLVEIVSSGLTSVRGLIVYDGENPKKIYWTDSSGKIGKANTDGTEVETIISEGLSNPDALVIDESDSPDVMFIGDGTRIMRANIDGSNLVEIITQDLVNITDIAISDLAPCQELTGLLEINNQERCAGDTVTFRMDAQGSPQIAFQWRKDGVVIEGATEKTYSINPVTLEDAGLYDCIVSNPCGEVKSDSAELIVNPNPQTSIQPNPALVCAGTPIVLNGSPSGGSGVYVGHLWEGQVSPLNNAQVQNPTFLTPTAGSYSLSYTVTDNNGCKGRSDVAVTVNGLPIVEAGEDRVICQGKSATLVASASGGTPAYTFTWSDGFVGAQNTVLPVATTIYYVTVTDASNCIGVDSVTVVVNPNPTASAGSDQEICNGETAILVASATGGTGGYTYQWSNGVSGSGNPVAPEVTTTYSVTVTDSKGCTDIAAVTVTVFPVPVINLGPDQEICEGEEANLDATISSGTEPYTINWSDGSSSASRVVTPTETTTYSLTVTDAQTCSDEASIKVTVNKKPKVNLGPDQEICEEEEVTLQATATEGTPPYRSFSWNNGKNGETIKEKPTETTEYKVKVVDDKGCEAEASVNVKVYPKIELIMTPDEEICEEEEVEIKGDASGGTAPLEFLWEDGSTSSSRKVKPDQTETYSLTVTDASQICEAKGDVTLTVNPKPSVSLGPDQDLCKGEDIDLTAEAEGGTPSYKEYKWSPSGSGSSINVKPEETTIYTVTVVDSKDCEASDEIKVTVFEKPKVDAGPDKRINEKDTAVLVAVIDSTTGKPPFTFKWSDGSTKFVNKVSPVAATTIFTITVTDDLGCTGTDQVGVIVNPNMKVQIDGGKEICAGSSLRLQAVVTGGVGPYSYDWSHDASSQFTTVSPDKTTLYSVIVTDSEGRANFAQVTIQVVGNPIVSLGQDKTIFEKESITLEPSISKGNPPPKSYQWNNGKSTLKITETPGQSTNYSVTVTDQKGCKGGDKVKVIVIPKTGEGIAGPDRKICKDGSTVLGLPGRGNICYFWEPKEGLDNQKIAQPTATPSKTTTYKLTITGEDFSFKESDEVVVEVVEKVEKITVTPKKCCWKVGDTLKLSEFDIVTSPANVEGKITITPEIITPGYLSITDAIWPVLVKFTFDCGDKKVEGETRITVINEDVSAEYSEAKSLTDNKTVWKNNLEKKLAFLKGSFLTFGCKPDVAADYVEKTTRSLLCCSKTPYDCIRASKGKSVGLSFGMGVRCEKFIYGIPYMSELKAVFGGGISLQGNIGGQTQCELPKICGAVAFGGNFIIGLSYQIGGGDVLKADLVAVPAFEFPPFEVCVLPQLSAKFGKACYKVDVEGGVTMLSFYTKKVTFSLVPKRCF